MQRREFLKTAGALAAAMVPAFASNAQDSTQRPPNIVLIMADDLGVETVGAYGGETYCTPNLDALAAEGVRFENCHSTPACTPSRVNILTGRYGFRTGEEWGTIPETEITFGHVLCKAGYATAIAGKWQLNLIKDDPEFIHRMGFDTYACWAWHEGPRYWNPMIWQDTKRLHEDIAHRYGPDVFVEYLQAFMWENRDRPFLAYYPMVLPHFAKTEDQEYAEPPGPNGRYQTYAEKMQRVDEMVGRVVRAIDAMGLRDNTIILFTADNGTPGQVTSIRNGKQVRGGKKKLIDAGTHVPLIVRWPGNIPAGSVNTDLVDFSDFLPTLAEIAGAELPDVTLDGVSFAPQLRGERGTPREWIYTQWQGEAWARTRDWKLYRDGRLVHMAEDPAEQRPIPEADDSAASQIARQHLAAVLERLID